MRNLNDGSRISGSSLPEILRGFDTARLLLRDHPRIKRKGLKIGHFLSAIAIHFLDLEEEEQLEILEYGLARLKEQQDLDRDPGGHWARPKKVTPAGGAGDTAGPKLAVDQKKPDGKPHPKRRSGS